MKHLLAPIVCLLAVSGCASDAVIADLETDKVIVRAGAAAKDETVMAEAQRGCSIHNRTAKAISSSCLGQYCTYKDHLFACMEKSG